MPCGLPFPWHLLLRCAPGWLQVAQLPRLSSLCVDHCDYSAASLAALSRLSGSLTHLDMRDAWIPGSCARSDCGSVTRRQETRQCSALCCRACAS